MMEINNIKVDSL